MSAKNERHETVLRNHATSTEIVMVRAFITFLLIAIALSIFSPTVLAANDPGHDTLYVLRTGDNVTGTYNFSGNLLINSTNVGINTTSAGSELTIGTSFATVAGITVDIGGAGDSALIVRKSASRPAFGILPWDSEVYLSSGIYYDGSAWVHHSNDNNNSLFVIDPGVGVTWYASNNGAGSWNVASAVTLWNTSGYWKNLVQSTATGNSYFTGGNVGIGTINPGKMLEINGSNNVAVFMNRSGANAAVVELGAYNRGYLYSYTGYNLSLGAGGNADYVTINTAGSVGIGTTNPTQKLDVNGSVNISGTSAKLYTPEICLAGSCQTSWPAGSGGSGGWTNSSTNTSTMLNVGIGTTNPSRNLHVYSVTDPVNGFNGQLQIGGNLNVNNDIYLSIGVYNTTEYAFLQAAKSNVGARPIVLQPMGGNVSIGTLTPTQKLDVNGSINISGTSAKLYTPEICLAGSCQTSWPAGGAGGSGGWTNSSTNTSTMLNVGIGTTNPTSYANYRYLEVVGGSTTDGGVFRTAVSNSAVVGQLWTDSEGVKLRATTAHPVFLGSSITVLNSGNVGIGTTSPDAKLDVNGSVITSDWTTGSGFYVKYDPAPTNYYLGVSLDTANRGMNLTSIMASGNTGFHFTTGTAASNSEKMSILDSGYVGIGTTAPDKTLHVAGDIHVGGVGKGIYFDTTGSVAGSSIKMYDYYMILTNDRGNGATLNLTNNYISFADSSATRFFIQTNGATAGYIGIGVTSPTAKLEVNGGIRMNVSTAKPTCDSTQRGTMWYQNDYSGSQDVLWTCMKGTTGTYAWIMVARGT